MKSREVPTPKYSIGDEVLIYGTEQMLERILTIEKIQIEIRPGGRGEAHSACVWYAFKESLRMYQEGVIIRKIEMS